MMAPLPVPLRLTDSGKLGDGTLLVNVAVSAAGAFIVTAQGPMPLQSPIHPAKVEPTSGVAVSVTTLPKGKLVLHVTPQLIPGGVLVTVPVPEPPRTMESGGVSP